jgi:hypothetical protein
MVFLCIRKYAGVNIEIISNKKTPIKLPVFQVGDLDGRVKKYFFNKV